jgi:DNA-binding NarL/FixJ family response regulator
MVERIKILVFGSSRLLREVVVDILAEAPEIDVVTEVPEPEQLTARAGATSPDCVIASLEDADLSTLLPHLLLRGPRMKVLALTDDGRTGFLYELRPERVPVGELSSETLLDVVRRGRAA